MTNVGEASVPFVLIWRTTFENTNKTGYGWAFSNSSGVRRERQLLLENQGEWNFVTLNKISSQCHICPDVSRTADSSWRNFTHATVAQMPSLRLLQDCLWLRAERRTVTGSRYEHLLPLLSARDGVTPPRGLSLRFSRRDLSARKPAGGGRENAVKVFKNTL